MDEVNASNYNSLLLIQHASARFDDQLASAGLSRSEFFAELAPLFTEKEYTKRYAVCLVHRHFALENGERMVAKGNVSAPTTDLSSDIIPERWLSAGGAFEYQIVDESSPFFQPPSADFFSNFKAVLDKFGIDVLGICCVPQEKIPPGYWLLEAQGVGERELVTNVVPYSVDTKTTFHSSWIMEDNGKTMGFCYSPLHGCKIMCT